MDIYRVIGNVRQVLQNIVSTANLAVQDVNSAMQRPDMAYVFNNKILHPLQQIDGMPTGQGAEFRLINTQANGVLAAIEEFNGQPSSQTAGQIVQIANVFDQELGHLVQYNNPTWNVSRMK